MKFNDDGMRMTDCCGAASKFMDGGPSGEVLCCKKCYEEVAHGQGDGSEYRTTAALQAEIDNALEILDGYYEVNEGATEVGLAALTLIANAPELLAALKLVSRKQTPASWDAVAKAIRSATGGAA